MTDLYEQVKDLAERVQSLEQKADIKRCNHNYYKVCNNCEEIMCSECGREECSMCKRSMCLKCCKQVLDCGMFNGKYCKDCYRKKLLNTKYKCSCGYSFSIIHSDLCFHCGESIKL